MLSREPPKVHQMNSDYLNNMDNECAIQKITSYTGVGRENSRQHTFESLAIQLNVLFPKLAYPDAMRHGSWHYLFPKLAAFEDRATWHLEMITQHKMAAVCASAS